MGELKLTARRRAQVIKALEDKNSIATIVRMTGLPIPTVVGVVAEMLRESEALDRK